MEEFDYSLDIIITKLALHQKEGHFTGFIKFGEHTIEVPAILTSNFQCGRSIVVRSTQQELRHQLQSCPIVLEIFKDRTEKFAEVTIPWPEIAIIRLENPAFSCDTQIECVTFPEGLVALVLKVAKVQMIDQQPLRRTESVECLTESEDDDFVPVRFAANDYKIINGRVVRMNSDQCMQLPPRACPKPNRPVTSGLETERYKWPPKTCHELFGNRLAGEKCHLCQEQLLTAKGPLCDSCGGVSVNTKMTEQMKVFDHHLCIQDCPMGPVAKQFQPEDTSRCSTDSPALACYSEQPVCCDCCDKTGKLCEKCSQNKHSPPAMTQRIRLSRTSKKSQLITLTNKDGKKKKYKIEVEFVHTAKKGAKRCGAKEIRRRRPPCRPSIRPEKLRPSAQYAEQIYRPKGSMFFESSNDEHFETSRRRIKSEKAGNRTGRKSQTRESRVSSDLMTETSEESTEKQSIEDEATRESELRTSKSKKKKAKRRSFDTDEVRKSKKKWSKGKKRSSDSDESQTAKSKSKKKSKRRSSDSEESQSAKSKSRKKSKRRSSDSDDTQKSQESQEGQNPSVLREPKNEPKSPKPTAAPAGKSKDTHRQSLTKDVESVRDASHQQKPFSKPIAEDKRRHRESDDVENEAVNRDQSKKRKQKGDKTKNRESGEEDDDEDPTDLMESRKRTGKKRKPNDKTDQRDRDQEFSIAIEPDEIGDRLQRGPKRGKGPSRIKISIKPVDGESGDKAAMKGFCRLRGGGSVEAPAPHFQSRKEFIKYMKSKMTKRYSYKFGRRYPGVVIGHNHNVEVPRVPSYMGWLWNIKTLGINKIRRGWKPGAIRKPIKEMMSYFLDPYPYDTLPVSRRQKLVGPCPSNQVLDAGQREKPTLRVQKKNGEYSITMNPLNEAAAPGESPYLPCRPIKFTLAADERGRKLAQVRDIIKAQGYQLCKCDSLTTCQCRDQAQNWLLQSELDRLTECLQIQEPISYKDLRTSESEMDIEFTPPSVVMRPKQKKRADNATAETQYDQTDYLAGQTYTCLAGSMDQALGGGGGEGSMAAGVNKGVKSEKKGETNAMGQPKGQGLGPVVGGQHTTGKSGVTSKVGLKNTQTENTADQQGPRKLAVGAKGGMQNDRTTNQQGVGKPGAGQNGKTAGEQGGGKPGAGGKRGSKNVQNDKTTDQNGVAKPGAGGQAGLKNAQNDKTAGEKSKKDGGQKEEASNTQKGEAGKAKPAGKNENSEEVRYSRRIKKDGAVPFSVLLKDPCNNVRPCCPVLPPCQTKYMCSHQCCSNFCCKPNLCCQTQKC